MNRKLLFLVLFFSVFILRLATADPLPGQWVYMNNTTGDIWYTASPDYQGTVLPVATDPATGYMYFIEYLPGIGLRQKVSYDGGATWYHAAFVSSEAPAGYVWQAYSPPPPVDVVGELSLDGFEAVNYQVKIDTDSDGVPDTLIQSGTLTNDQPGFSFEPSGNAAWEVRAVSGQLGEIFVPLDQVISSGAGLPVDPPAPSVSYEPSETLGSVSVSENGTVTKNPVSIGTVTVNGETKTQYTAKDPSGSGSTSFSFGSSGAASVTASDIRSSQVQNSAENAALLAAVKANTASTATRLDDLIALAEAAATATPSPSPTPSPTPDPDDDLQSEGSVGTFTVTGVSGAENPSAVSAGTKPSWVLKFPGVPQSFNFDPELTSWFLPFCAWLKVITWWILTIWITAHVYKSINELSEACFQRLQGADIQRLSMGKEQKESGLNLGIAVIRVPNLVKVVAANVIWRAAILAAIAIFAGLVGGQFFTFGGITNWYLGGGTFFSSLAAAILPNHPALMGSLYYLGLTIPMDHALNCGAIWFATHAIKPVIVFFFGFFVRAS